LYIRPEQHPIEWPALTFSGEYYRALISGQSRGLGPALQRSGLGLASVPYSAGVWLRNWLFDQGWRQAHRAAVPVVSVGNLTLGGTGKTPCVEYVARFYRQQKLRVAILSRGYGNRGGRNDEALVLEQNLPDVPHLQGVDRLTLARAAVEEWKSEVLVLDDGLQHRRLARDLDVVLLDATNPWGYGYLFPRGLLREPPASLRRAGAIVLTRWDQADREQRQQLRRMVSRLAPHAPIGETTHQPHELMNSEQGCAPLEEFVGRPVAAFCGIGNPEAFRRTLADLGANVSAFRVFPDHHAYGRVDVEKLEAWAEQQARECYIVTTQKDLVKLRQAQLGGRPLWALRIGLQFENGQEAFEQSLMCVCASSGRPKRGLSP
jgi:tetraacyldisaccharide 4'-kinase